MRVSRSILLVAASAMVASCASDSTSPTSAAATSALASATRSAPVVLDPDSLTFRTVGPGEEQFVSASVKFAGELHLRLPDSCAAVVRVSPERVRAIPARPVTFTFVPIGNGGCTVAIADKKGATATVVVLVIVQQFNQFTVASDVSTANSDESTPGRLAAVTVGDDALVVSCRQLGVPLGLFGTVIDSVGHVRKSFRIAEHNCNFPSPSVSSSPGGLVVVFQRNGTIVSTRLSPAPDYAVLGETSLSSGFAPVVAFGGNGYFVAWAKARDFPQGYDIFGARLGTDGQVLSEQPVFTMTGEQVEPSIAFDGVNYLVVWRDTRSGSGPASDTDIYGARVSREGVVLDPAGLPICTASGYQGEPALTYGGGAYFAAWADTRRLPDTGLPGSDIFGTRISPAGTPLDGATGGGGIAIATAPIGAGPLAYPSVVFDGQHYATVFSAIAFEPPEGIYYSRVTTGGALLDGPADRIGVSLSGAPPEYATLVHPVIVSNTVRSVAAWVNNSQRTGDDKDVVGVVIRPF